MTDRQQKRNSSEDEFVFATRSYNEHNKRYIAQMSTKYNMNHKKRGFALIFNHEIFKSPKLDKRTGTEKDCTSLAVSLKNLGFDVKIYNNKEVSEIDKICEEVARADHTDNDCIIIAILSHGEEGFIHAKDSPYKIDLIVNHFSDNKCKTLVGKPKLFFIQACQGHQLDPGIELKRLETNGPTASCRFPLHVDFLFAYSTIPGFLSWRNELNGSWFIQSLCRELDANGTCLDILTLLTFVCQRVAIDFESNTKDIGRRYKKQTTCTATMLTRILKFSEKKCVK